jgi:hypothetical protein
MNGVRSAVVFKRCLKTFHPKRHHFNSLHAKLIYIPVDFY